ncbi:hypothetical protein N9K06_00515 [Omnitrophica bacterium]|nr:hypothetical protein [Candidatus Omnitrophota bacterium]
MATSNASPDSPARKRVYKRRARNLIIHRPIQREFTLVLVALLIVSSLAIGFVIHDTLREASIGGGLQFGKINPYEVLNEVRYQLILRVTAILFVALIVIGFFSVFFLHRVAGPVHRFRQIFMSVNDGEEPHEISLREGDFFHETAMEINRLMRSWKAERLKGVEIKAKIADILKSKPAQEVEQAAREIEKIVDKDVSAA